MALCDVSHESIVRKGCDPSEWNKFPPNAPAGCGVAYKDVGVDGFAERSAEVAEWCERVPPMENQSLHLQTRSVRNPYPQMTQFLLKKYPDLRFQDAYVDGNDWSCGNDAFRDDHPVMQFVARQLEFMNGGLSKKKAFERTEELFRERRAHLEREQKIMMATALNAGFTPMFSTGAAYLEAEKAKAETAHLEIIRRRLREMKKNKQREAEHEARTELSQDGAGEELDTRPTLASRRKDERDRLSQMERERRRLVDRTKFQGSMTKEIEYDERVEQLTASEQEPPLDTSEEIIEQTEYEMLTEQRVETKAKEVTKPAAAFAPQQTFRTLSINRRRSRASQLKNKHMTELEGMLGKSTVWGDRRKRNEDDDDDL
eukprot:CAMPEP_0194491226 /NCGR_PEP_ID=MMETSP0253-20130528/10174_1 /TAXON_ID=2966 /ORGANISM="Noctiluca scintillans" /LENGTH=371 /DNA_ID=CAMNT_0039331937 /DNA_START=24 /DNA_END=1140 /DNA_ORIENTATION=-